MAGGIYNGDDVQHMLEEVGADGVQVGTRFVTTEECDAPMSYKRAVPECKRRRHCDYEKPGRHAGTCDQKFFFNSGPYAGESPGECLQCLEKCNPAQIPYCITQALVNAVTEKDGTGTAFLRQQCVSQ